jgi:hypothetical protein
MRSQGFNLLWIQVTFMVCEVTLEQEIIVFFWCLAPDLHSIIAPRLPVAPSETCHSTVSVWHFHILGLLFMFRSSYLTDILEPLTLSAIVACGISRYWIHVWRSLVMECTSKKYSHWSRIMLEVINFGIGHLSNETDKQKAQTKKVGPVYTVCFRNCETNGGGFSWS